MDIFGTSETKKHSLDASRLANPHSVRIIGGTDQHKRHLRMAQCDAILYLHINAWRRQRDHAFPIAVGGGCCQTPPVHDGATRPLPTEALCQSAFACITRPPRRKTSLAALRHHGHFVLPNVLLRQACRLRGVCRTI